MINWLKSRQCSWKSFQTEWVSWLILWFIFLFYLNCMMNILIFEDFNSHLILLMLLLHTEMSQVKPFKTLCFKIVYPKDQIFSQSSFKIPKKIPEISCISNRNSWNISVLTSLLKINFKNFIMYPVFSFFLCRIVLDCFLGWKMNQKGNNCSRWKILNRDMNMLKQLFDIFLTGIIKNFNPFLIKKLHLLKT